MSGDGKILKLACIAALFAGIASLACGVVLAIGNMVDVDAILTALEGVVAAVFGARTAILANVPSNTAKIRGKALVLTLLAVACVGYMIYCGQNAHVAQLCIAGVVCAIAVVCLVTASRIVKEQLRK